MRDGVPDVLNVEQLLEEARGDMGDVEVPDPEGAVERPVGLEVVVRGVHLRWPRTPLQRHRVVEALELASPLTISVDGQVRVEPAQVVDVEDAAHECVETEQAETPDALHAQSVEVVAEHLDRLEQW